MIKIGFILFIFLIIEVKAQTYKNLSEFKTQVQTVQRTALSLYSGVNYFGEFISFLNGSELASVDQKSYDKLMKQLLTEEKYLEFRDRFKDKSIISINELKDFGFEFSVDLNNFRVDIYTSELFLKPNVISLSNYSADSNEVKVNGGKFSSYLNYSFSNVTKYEKTFGRDSHTFGILDPVVNINSLVVESNHYLSPEHGWIRNGSIITKDFKDPLLRINLGDVQYVPRTLQSSQQLLGFKISKEYEINPYMPIVAKADRELYLEVPSAVEIFINGQLIQTLNLEAGKHKLEDIPVLQGINHVVLRVSDNKGNKKLIVFQHTGSEDMLKVGFHDFNYAVGRFAENSDRGIRYGDQNSASFFHRYGVLNTWTSGFKGEYIKNYINLGAENIVSTVRGLFTHDVSFSSASGGKGGVANRFSYTWTCPCGINDQIKRLFFSYEYDSPNYLINTFKKQFALNNQRNIFQINYTQRLTESIMGTIGVNLQSLSMFDFFQKQIGLTFNKNLGNDFFVTGTYQRTMINKNVKTNSDYLLVQLSYGFDEGKRNIIATVNKSVDGYSAQTEYNYNKNLPVNNHILYSRANLGEKTQAASISHFYNHKRFEIFSGLDYSSLNQTKTITINPSGSFSFVDGEFAFGQKIQQGFVLVANKEKENLVINGDEEKYEAYVTGKSNVSLVSVQPYTAKQISIVSDDSNSLGYSNKGYRAQVGYKQGALLELGDDDFKMVSGNLVNAEKVPYSLVGAKLINLSTGIDTPFFTGRDGKFYLENVKEDIYQLMIYDKQNVRVLNLDLRGKLPKERNDLGNVEVK